MKKAKSKRTNRGWGQVFSFVKMPKIEPPKDSVYGCTFRALRSIKRGTVQQVLEQAMKEGLHKVTKQNPKVQVQIKLRRLVKMGCAKVEKVAGKEDEAPKKKPVAKKKVAPKKSKPLTKPAPPVPEPPDEDLGDD